MQKYIWYIYYFETDEPLDNLSWTNDPYGEGGGDAPLQIYKNANLISKWGDLLMIAALW